MFTRKEAIVAITARLAGEYDNEQLAKVGDLRTDPWYDIEFILANTMPEPVPPPQLHVIEVTFLANTKGVVLKSYYFDQELTIPLNNEPGSITPAIETAQKYLENQGHNVVGKGTSKGKGIYHIVMDTFFPLVPNVGK